LLQKWGVPFPILRAERGARRKSAIQAHEGKEGREYSKTTVVFTSLNRSTVDIVEKGNGGVEIQVWWIFKETIRNKLTLTWA